MANGDLLTILRDDVHVWNAFRLEHPDESIDFGAADLKRWDLSNADLHGAGFRGADLREANLRGTDLNKANLRRADLREANLNEAILRWADLSEANLRRSDLSRADLHGADLSEADLRESLLRGALFSRADFSGANLSEANLSDADLREAVCRYTVFGDVDLSGIRSLELVRHFGPSTIGVDTLYRSRGRIPKEFLIGAGVPELLIDYVPSLIGVALVYDSCFISHSHKDEAFCDRLQRDLRRRGIRVWYFPEDARGGKTVRGEVDQGIQEYDKLVLVCSEASLTSGPVQREIERALQREDREHKDILFPLRIDDYLFNQWDHPLKADVVAKVARDFRGTTDRRSKKYDEALDRLVKDLQK